MSFNPRKWIHLKISSKHFFMPTSYNLDEHTILQSQSATYLRVTIDQKLQWSEHISNTVSKANAANTFLKRNLSGCSSKVEKIVINGKAYTGICFSSLVTLQYTQSDIYKIEMAQHHAVRFISNNFSCTASVTNVCSNVQLPTGHQLSTTDISE